MAIAFRESITIFLDIAGLISLEVGRPVAPGVWSYFYWGWGNLFC